MYINNKKPIKVHYSNTSDSTKIASFKIDGYKFEAEAETELDALCNLHDSVKEFSDDLHKQIDNQREEYVKTKREMVKRKESIFIHNLMHFELCAFFEYMLEYKWTKITHDEEIGLYTSKHFHHKKTLSEIYEIFKNK